MIFEETEEGGVFYIPHREMMCEDVEQFISIILKARSIYKRNRHADMDDDYCTED